MKLSETELLTPARPASRKPASTPQTDSTLQTDAGLLVDIWSRRGEPDLRQRLLDAWDSRCAISGCDVVDALEASRILPAINDQSLRNALLLRADLHTLFDLFLLSIDPTSQRIHIAPRMVSCYGDLDGLLLRQPVHSGAQPHSRYLQRHYSEWCRRWL